MRHFAGQRLNGFIHWCAVVRLLVRSRAYSLSELCIITRAAPARIAGLKTKGHLGPGADADVTVYRRDADLERMFSLPAFVLKAGTLVVEDGHVRSYPVGQTFACLPECS